ncbi:Fic family protein [Nocardioides aurantiacus]|uniref:Fic family protein n=1 Tax=Nocardioides aurantiacus TaxID=86796 RepID=UPI000F466B59|nr:Fic family protein [Nocardioides aurantiacus]
MESFVDLDRCLGSVPGAVVTKLARVDVGRGREELFRNQLPALLTELANRARVASITASSALEGIVVSDQSRAAVIISGKAAVLRTRSEQELAGYRAALDYLFGNEWRPLNVGLLLHLHRELFANTKSSGGHFKDTDNLVVDRSPDGTVDVRFVPVPASRTKYYTAELVDRYRDALTTGDHHPVLLIGLFVLDLLTIHPFEDGNGRVVRALTNALLDDTGYTVGKYVSLEQLIAETADTYYAALLGSTHGWHERTNDPWPWLSYFVDVLSRAYERFEQGTAAQRSTGTKQDRVREYVTQHAPQIFKIGDIRAALPGVSDPTIRLALDQLKREGSARPEGTGRAAAWVKTRRDQ